MPPIRQFNISHHRLHKQRGAALMVMLVILIVGSAAFLVSSLSRSALQIERDQKTADALVQAKEALIGYAASANLSNPSAASPRPGNLPCPDTNNDGASEASCSGNALGRLPWKTLGLPDLRDGSGERLWYAVSINFKKSPYTSCTAPGQAGCLNSDTIGTITVRTSDGSIQYDGSASSGAVAIIIAPGDALQRTDKTSPQDRSSAGINTASNYLDIANGEDNASFTDTSTDGFIQGRIKGSNGNTILNDQLLVITQDNIMQAIQKRVVGEVKQCLNEYATNGIGLYPWAAKLDPTQPPNYSDTNNRLFGRIPDTPFNATESANDAMNDQWGVNCNIISNSGWWLNWKEMVFYGLSDAYSPNQNTSAPMLVVNPPSTTADKKFVVVVAGKKLTGQVRNSNADKGTLTNYLETPNSGGSTSFAQNPPSTTFNDTVIFQ